MTAPPAGGRVGDGQSAVGNPGGSFSNTRRTSDRRIVVLVKGWPRLSETFIAQELRGLELAGLDLSIVSLRRPTDKGRHAFHAEIAAPVSYLPEYLHEEPLRVLRGLRAALRKPGFGAAWRGFIGDLRHDLSRNRVRRFGQAAVLVAEWPPGAAWLHAHFIHTPASVADYAARIMGLPYTVSAHAKDIWTSTDRDLAGKLGRARWTVTCTASGYAHLQALAPDPARVHLSYHGLNFARFPPFDAGRAARTGADPADPVQIVSVGRAVPKKGYDLLLQALALLPQGLHWRFVHIGDGGERKVLRTLAESLGVAERTEWRGALDQAAVLAAYRAADVFALPCRITPDGDRDGLPNVLVEAASQRMALVSTAISAIPEVFTDGETALLVPPDDAPALARALETVIRSPNLRVRLGDASAERVRGSLDFHHSVAQLAGLFRAEWSKSR